MKKKKRSLIDDVNERLSKVSSHLDELELKAVSLEKQFNLEKQGSARYVRISVLIKKLQDDWLYSTTYEKQLLDIKEQVQLQEGK